MDILVQLGVKRYFIMSLIHISLMIKHVDDLFMGLMVICITSFEKQH